MDMFRALLSLALPVTDPAKPSGVCAPPSPPLLICEAQAGHVCPLLHPRYNGEAKHWPALRPAVPPSTTSATRRVALTESVGAFMPMAIALSLSFPT
jgi:hypothetical protein